MSSFDTISALPTGAVFYRADLHIHSFPASHDVKDAGMTPAAIVATAEKEGLSFIAVTDHNEISNVGTAIAAAVGTKVTVIPGVELSTPEGHLLVYFRTVETLQRYYAQLELEGRGTSDSRCSTSMLKCLKMIDPKDGFAVLAHVDGGNGLETKLAGGPPHKRDILAQPTLLGIELVAANSLVSFSDDDPDDVRREIGRQRINTLKHGRSQFLARVLFSDSHSLAQLGRNSHSDRRVTRFKAQAATFDGLLMAFLFADARVRIEDEIPTSIPYLEGVTIRGGFLDGQHVRFNRNLTCVIGGRGTGKSTLLEAARSVAPSTSKSGLVDSEVWPDTLEIFWRDQAGGVTTIRREKFRAASNVDDPFGLTAFPVECYSQNEISVQAQPAELLRFLDQFVEFADTKEADEDARRALLESQERIEELTRDVVQLPDNRRWLATTKQHFEALAAAKGTEVIELERKLAEERLLRERIVQVTKAYLDDRTAAPEKDFVEELEALAIPDSLRIGTVPWKAIIQAASILRDSSEPLRGQLKGLRDAFVAALKNQHQAWVSEEKSVRDEIQVKRDELQAQGIKLDMDYVRKLSHDLEKFTNKVNELEKKEQVLKEAIRERKKLVEHRTSCREAIGARRDGYATQATKALRDTLGELKLTIKFRRACLSPDAEEIVKQAMGWRTSQVPRATVLVMELSVIGLLKAIQSRDVAALTAIRHQDQQVFTHQDAATILDTLKRPEHMYRLERCDIEDLPQILVTAVPAGKTVPVTRDFAKLSLGQQQSVLLSLMLTSNSRTPLIIDQPEDNLDSEFIYRSLVAALRRAKERRQVIIVTHNANIAVLGDAEKLIVLKSVSDRGYIVAAESIDDNSARDMACEVLEGTSEAFRRRIKIYGM